MQRKRKYMGLVTDESWTQAVMEKYPNRNFRHSDQFKRRAMVDGKYDIPELATASCRHEARRFYND